MKVEQRQKRPMLLLTLALLLFAGCSAETGGPMERGLTANSNQVAESGKKAVGREVALGEGFTVSPNEKVSVKEANLTLELKGVRRSWLANSGGEFVDAQVLIDLDGKEQTEWIKLGGTVMAGDYVIKLTEADSFGKTSAQLIVTRR